MTRSERTFVAACWTAVALSLVLQAAGAVRRNVHWDEFIFLSNVHTWARGEPLRLFQTVYVHLFRWLPAVSADELDQVRVGRATLLVAWVGSLALLHRLALQATDRVGAAAAVAAAALLSENLVHAASLRVDGLMVPLFLGASLAATVPSARRMALAGALAGALLALSLKAFLILPVVAAVGLLRAEGQPDRGRLGLAAAGAFVLACGGLLLAHAALLPDGPLPAGAPATEGAFVRGAAVRMLLGGDALPRQQVLLDSLRTDFPLWLCGVAGVVAALRMLRGEGSWARGWLILVMALPATLFAVYRNFWPYAFVSLLPTVAVAVGTGWAGALRSARRAGRLAAWAVLAWLAAVGAAVAREAALDGMRLQRQTLELVHALFPEPVSYVARVGVVASFPRPLFNMTTFGMETYLARGAPEVSRYIAEHRPPFLILDSSTLAVFGDPDEAGVDPRPALLSEDADRLRDAYAHFWGPVYLAGRSWDRLTEGEERSFSIHVPGPFTLLAAAPASVDGVIVQPGGSVELGAGAHRIVSASAQEDVALLRGRGLVRPSHVPAPGPFYAGF